MNPFIPPPQIRARFARALSRMYRSEVPLYDRLSRLIDRINRETLEAHPDLEAQLQSLGELEGLGEERHGAIRLGLPSELATMRRLFAVMGMQPVAYYDLSAAGIPVHSTAFRPIDSESLKASPFRVFTSLLRLELIDDEALREQARSRLEQRQIFTPGLLRLIDLAENQGGLNEQDAEEFVDQALETFRWHRDATVSQAEYRHFLDAHRLVADIVCFRGPHINHLTPRTLDIDLVQQAMPGEGFDAKPVIEGPPLRQHPILLRQTSFNALDEEVRFSDGLTGQHRARFGEIEQRGMALTRKGRALYDRLLAEARAQVPTPGEDPMGYQDKMAEVFSRFPDDLETLRREGLAWFCYRARGKAVENTSLNQMVRDAVLEIEPITYEDFLPVSAAGIFRSNLGKGENRTFSASPNQQAFEQALGCPVLDEFELYADLQRESLQRTLEQLGIDPQRRDRLLKQLPSPS